jgi:hypothetical protein
MVWELSDNGIVSAAKAVLVDILEIMLSLEGERPKYTPTDREHARTELNILDLGFIKQTNYREILASALEK